MNGKAQFYLNIGVTLVLGFYGTIGVLYSEILKPQSESSGWAIAIDLTISLLLIVLAYMVFEKSLFYINNDRAFPK